jgi:ceramide synthetase
MGLLESVKSINWEHESSPVYQDFRVLPLFAVFFPSIRFLLDRFVFEKLAKYLIYGKHRQDMGDDTTERKKKIRKFKESAWKCVYYLSAEILALSVTYNEPWFMNTKYFWVGPGDQTWPDQQTKLKLKLLYMFVAGFYTYSIFALVFWETRRSDFGVSMGHHIATLILIVLSYVCRYASIVTSYSILKNRTDSFCPHCFDLLVSFSLYRCSFSRVGSVVLALHDASDVFLEVGKMSKYSGAERIASFSFILFVLSWIILRLIYYPFWILWSTSYEVVLELDKDKHPIEGPIYYYMFNTLLYCLLVLHIYWWVLMYRMLVKQIQDRGKLSEDVRSDSEGEDEHED